MTAPTIAVMQPYLYPYAGYFRLLAKANVFVIFDCVQFPRRGRVHRTQVLGCDGRPRWLTLPLDRQPQDTRIDQLRFAPQARTSWKLRLDQLPSAKGEAATRIRDHLDGPLDDVVGFLEEGLLIVADLLGLKAHVMRSSALGIDSALRGQDRIIEIVQRLGGRRYLNAPGGKALYQIEAFARKDLELDFLPPYQGKVFHLLNTLLSGGVDDVRREFAAY